MAITGKWLRQAIRDGVRPIWLRRKYGLTERQLRRLLRNPNRTHEPPTEEQYRPYTLARVRFRTVEALRQW